MMGGSIWLPLGMILVRLGVTLGEANAPITMNRQQTYPGIQPYHTSIALFMTKIDHTHARCLNRTEEEFYRTRTTMLRSQLSATHVGVCLS